MAVAAEAWHREAIVIRIANLLLDRLERGPEARVRAPRVKLDSEAVPLLFEASAGESDFLWSLVDAIHIRCVRFPA